MKQQIFFLLTVLLFIACTTKPKNEKQSTGYVTYGDVITDKGAISKGAMAEKFKSLNEGDTISVKFTSTINEVCKKKGCWMKLDLGDNTESMVRFKDYGFFVPLDADNEEVIVEGKAYVTKISVEQLQHYAKDGGKSKEEIEAITEPELTYAFEAHGVLLKE